MAARLSSSGSSFGTRSCSSRLPVLISMPAFKATLRLAAVTPFAASHFVEPFVMIAA